MLTYAEAVCCVITIVPGIAELFEPGIDIATTCGDVFSTRLYLTRSRVRMRCHLSFIRLCGERGTVLAHVHVHEYAFGKTVSIDPVDNDATTISVTLGRWSSDDSSILPADFNSPLKTVAYSLSRP